MIKTKIMTLAALMAVAGMASTARADFTSTVTWPGNGTGTPPLNTLTVLYDVSLAASLYTYTYTITESGGPPTPTGILNFTVNTPYSTGINNFMINGVAGGGLVNGNTQVAWTFTSSPLALSDVVSFTSPNAPGLGGGSALDNTVSWAAGNTTLIATPVPEASTVMAGALMLLPFGIGAIRSLRKDRSA